MDAIVILAMLVALAVVAPRWGRDSTDGVDSPEWDRRASWRAGRIGRARGGAVARPPRRAVTRTPRPTLPRAAAAAYELPPVMPA